MPLEPLSAGDPPEEIDRPTGAMVATFYDELRSLAQSRLDIEPGNQSLNATALVHEAFLRLTGSSGREPEWENRRHFLGASAEAMRRILIERARARGRQKRGENPKQLDLSASQIIAPASDREMLAVSDALDHFETVNPNAAEIVKLRFFGGFTLQEIAEIHGVSYRTIKSRWAYARAWLRDSLHRQEKE